MKGVALLALVVALGLLLCWGVLALLGAPP